MLCCATLKQKVIERRDRLRMGGGKERGEEWRTDKGEERMAGDIRREGQKGKGERVDVRQNERSGRDTGSGDGSLCGFAAAFAPNKLGR